MTKRPVLLRVLGSLTDQVLSIGAVFIANIVLARAQSASEYGAFTLAYSLFTFLSGVHNGLLLESFTVYGSGRYRESFNTYWKFALKANLVIAFTLAGLVALGSMAVALFLGMGSVRSYLVLAAVSPLLLTSLFMRRVLYVESKSAQAGLMAAVFFMIVMALLYAASRLQVLTGSSVLLILAIAWLLASPIFIWHRRRGLLSSDFLQQNQGYLRQHWQYSKWVLLTALVFQLTAQGYLWLVAFLIDIRSVAALRAAWNVVQPAIVIFSSLSFVMLPRLAKLQQRRDTPGSAFSKEVLRYLMTVSIVAFGCAGLVWQFGALTYNIIYAGKYNGSVGLLYVAALMPVATAVASVFSDALRALEKPSMIFFAYVVGGLLTLVLGMPAVISHGVRGAAWGMVASNAGYAITLVVCYKWIQMRRAVRTQTS